MFRHYIELCFAQEPDFQNRNENMSVFASVKNAFILTDYSGYDPEVNSFAFDGLRPGVDMNSYPTPRSYIFGLNLTFNSITLTT